jgi:putative two-component system response regulator
MSSILRPSYDVCAATSGSNALDVAKSQSPDLIILDNLMPEMTGVETCIALKEMPETASIPVIFLTSMDDKHNEQMGFKAGAIDYMHKPPTAELVLARVGIHLKSQRQRRFLSQLAEGEITDPELIRVGAKHLIDL